MAQIVWSGDITVHPSEAIEVHGKTDAGRDVKIYLSNEAIDTLKKVFAFSAEHGNMHIGHSHWHIINPDQKFPCSGCDIKE